ncbi:hypothetical protein DH2020_026200 [Rehmannia glutinosa]|uniref:Pistil-specific extensin-like protein n=1 Tax=Rehmannia glutinosa TaxID=99300 RepID=A0ABR0W1L3_REHGL
MGANILLMIAAISLVLVGSVAGHGIVETPKVFHVAGKVLCQDCDQGWNEWVNGAKPIKGCKVSVTCLDDRNRVVHYASDLTDEAGDFDITCNEIVNKKIIKPENCFLRLVSSPDPVCNVATNFAGGKSGVKLHRPNVVYRDLVKYVLGPFYYTTPMCDEPDTSSPDEQDVPYDDVGSVAGHGMSETPDQVFHVAGKVLCQDCDKGSNLLVNEAKPIKGMNQIFPY